MTDVARIGVSLEGALLTRFDQLLEDRGIKNRSEALRDLVREHLVAAELDDETETVGSVTLVYDHRKRALSSGLTAEQHSHAHHVISSMHVHLDEAFCLEVIVLKGALAEIRRIADRLIGQKGVLHGKLVVTSIDSLAGRRPRGAPGAAAGQAPDARRLSRRRARGRRGSRSRRRRR